MPLKAEIKRLRAFANFLLQNKGLTVENVSISNIPKQWEKFRDTEDEWISLFLPENVNMSGCLYSAKYGSEFEGHKHNLSVEIITVLNKGGEIHVFTPTYDRIVKHGEAIRIEMGEPHIVLFTGLPETLISVIWHPKMEGWTADFLNKDK